jgi:hypothetical protein
MAEHLKTGLLRPNFKWLLGLDHFKKKQAIKKYFIHAKTVQARISKKLRSGFQMVYSIHPKAGLVRVSNGRFRPVPTI